MQRHQTNLAPKFALVQETSRPFGESLISRLTDPKDGYFLNSTLAGHRPSGPRASQGCRISVHQAGSAFHLPKDPEDKNIRSAPSFPCSRTSAPRSTAWPTCALLSATESLLKN